MYSGKCMLLFQQFVDVLGVIDGGVQQENQFGNDAELFSDHPSEFAADAPHVFLQGRHRRFRFRGGENAHIDLRDGEVGADPDLADRHHGTAEGGHAFAPDDFGEVLLEFPRHLELSCACRCFHLDDIDDEIILLASLGEDVLAMGLLSEWVEGTRSTSLVIVTPSDGLLQLLVLVLHTTVEAQQIVVWLEFDVQVVVL